MRRIKLLCRSGRLSTTPLKSGSRRAWHKITANRSDKTWNASWASVSAASIFRRKVPSVLSLKQHPITLGGAYWRRLELVSNCHHIKFNLYQWAPPLGRLPYLPIYRSALLGQSLAGRPAGAGLPANFSACAAQLGLRPGGGGRSPPRPHRHVTTSKRTVSF